MLKILMPRHWGAALQQAIVDPGGDAIASRG
jgi:hypothetical protein